MSKQLQFNPGDRFGKLVVLKQNGFYIYPNSNKKSFLWECLCDCGCIKNIRGTYLKKGMSRSCGCMTIISSRKKYTESNFNSLYYFYKKRAELKNKLFELTKQDFKNITSQKCYYCDVIPYNKTETQTFFLNNGYYIYNGIDRVDNTKGYTLDNCVSCCKKCNYAKHKMSISEFFNMIKNIYEKHLK